MFNLALKYAYGAASVMAVGFIAVVVVVFGLFLIGFIADAAGWFPDGYPVSIHGNQNEWEAE